MRQLSDVLTAIIAELPAEEAALRERMESVRKSALYAAPETQSGWWKRAAHILGDRVAELMGASDPFPEWPERTRRIFAGESPEVTP